jgi:hypothetical protein
MSILSVLVYVALIGFSCSRKSRASLSEKGKKLFALP